MTLFLRHKFSQRLTRSQANPYLAIGVLCQLLESCEHIVVSLNGDLNIIGSEVRSNGIGDSRLLNEQNQFGVGDDCISEEDRI